MCCTPIYDLPEFAGRNLSPEHFARVLCDTLAGRIKTATVSVFTVKLWESEIAWEAYRKER